MNFLYKSKILYYSSSQEHFMNLSSHCLNLNEYFLILKIRKYLKFEIESWYCCSCQKFTKCLKCFLPSFLILKIIFSNQINCIWILFYFSCDLVIVFIATLCNFAIGSFDWIEAELHFKRTSCENSNSYYICSSHFHFLN